jgi:hypothetical protein
LRATRRVDRAIPARKAPRNAASSGLAPSKNAKTRRFADKKKIAGSDRAASRTLASRTRDRAGDRSDELGD